MADQSHLTPPSHIGFSYYWVTFSRTPVPDRSFLPLRATIPAFRSCNQPFSRLEDRPFPGMLSLRCFQCGIHLIWSRATAVAGRSLHCGIQVSRWGQTGPSRPLFCSRPSGLSVFLLQYCYQPLFISFFI
jgi:hypothetical protein